MADEDDRQLHEDDEVDDAVGGAKPAMRFAEPVSENTIFGHAVEHAVRSDDSGVDGARKNQESDKYDENAEENAKELRPHQVHGEAGDQVVFVNRAANLIRDEHHRE